MSKSRRLLAWYRDAARELPWRVEPRDPYRVLVSELMLQQTQVDRVVPRFDAFMVRFPTLATLAEADVSKVLEAWSGLGYYRRARSLHRLAREVVARGSGLPQTAAELCALPGIGPYTAAAVASLAFGAAEPVLDGNVMRVAARFLTMGEEARRAPGRAKALRWVRGLMEGAEPGRVNEALMELGATVCTPRAPACPLCPLREECRARVEGRPEEHPPARRVREPEHLRWLAACAVSGRGRWLLRRVEAGAVLRGLWLPPFADAGDGDVVATALGLLPFPVDGGVSLPPVRHSITYRRISVVPVRVAVARELPLPDGWAWADPLVPGLPTSSLLAKLVRRANK
ncbi:MAG: A/G-specific adenine glycosylase [Acidobacteria bacterium]|nr:A/G-specific adenine glycosylase [Acidobacteriota bacterium]